MKGRIQAILGVAMSLQLLATAAAAAGIREAACAAPSAAAAQEDPAITVGVEKERVWLESTIDGLRVRKFTQRGGASVLELRHGNDHVVFSASSGRLSASRGGQTVVVEAGSAQTLEAVYELLAPSRAVLQARAVLSRLERRSSLGAPQMSLLSSIAFVAAVMGDVEAPHRLSERFGMLHAGRVRPVRYRGSCWSNYTTETMAAQDDLNACLLESSQGSVFLKQIRDAACQLTWILRVESAWFEWIKCAGLPLTQGG